MLGLTFCSKLDWGSYIICIAKTASKKIEALICSMKFLSPEVALYLYKSTIFHVWNTVVISGLVLLVASCDCQTSSKNEYAGLLVLHLLLGLNSWLFGQLGQLMSFQQALLWQMFFRTGTTGSTFFILLDCMIFLSPFLDVTRMSTSTVSFLAQLDSGILCLQNAFL